MTDPAAARPGRAASAAPPALAAALEAVLLVVDEPVDVPTLARAVDRDPAEVEATLYELQADYDEAGRGFELRALAGGWRLYTRASCASAVERFALDGQSGRLSQAALETLAIVAYRQPVSRGRIAAVRGVNVDRVLRTLVTRGLVTEQGSDPETGAVLFGTTPLFAERLGIGSVDELPSLAPLLPALEEVETEAQPDTR